MTFVTFKEFLVESPMSIGDEEFGLSDEKANKRYGAKLCLGPCASL